MQRYKKISESLYIPNKIKLILDSSVDSGDNKEEVYKTFFENLILFQDLADKSLNYEQIHIIFNSFKKFIKYFPDKIRECFSPELCSYIQSFIDENLIYSNESRIVKDAMKVIAYLCYFDVDFIQFFSDNNIYDQVTNVYRKSTHELYESLIFLFDSLLVKNTLTAVCEMCNFIFSSTNNYCFALLRGLDEDRKNIRVAISFFYFLVEYPENLEKDKILRIFDVVEKHIEWNEQCPIPNDIFVFTLWTYYNLLNNYSIYMNNFVNSKMISAVGLLLENDFDEQVQAMEIDNLEVHDNYVDLEKHPQRPLLAIFRIFYTKIFPEEIFQCILESTSFSRIIELTSSNDLKVALESFDIIKNIIVHHTDLIEDLLSFDLIPCLQNALEDSFYLKEASYECVCELLRSGVPDVVFNILQNEVFLLSVEYISADFENKLKTFLDAILRALKLMEKNGWINEIINYFSKNDVYDFFEQISEEQQIDLLSDIMRILSS